MKRDFFDILFRLMQENKNIYIIFVGLGYPRVEEFQKEFGNRAINTEASEQVALDIAVGLCYESKIPFVYTITPFFYRAWETIRTYIAHENLNVKLVGAGRGTDYSIHDGYSHDACDIEKSLMLFSNIKQYYPDTKEEVLKMIKNMIKLKTPAFISLTR